MGGTTAVGLCRQAAGPAAAAGGGMSGTIPPLTGTGADLIETDLIEIDPIETGIETVTGIETGAGGDRQAAAIAAGRTGTVTGAPRTSKLASAGGGRGSGRPRRNASEWQPGVQGAWAWIARAWMGCRPDCREQRQWLDAGQEQGRMGMGMERMVVASRPVCLCA